MYVKHMVKMFNLHFQLFDPVDGSDLAVVVAALGVTMAVIVGVIVGATVGGIAGTIVAVIVGSIVGVIWWNKRSGKEGDYKAGHLFVNY